MFSFPTIFISARCGRFQRSGDLAFQSAGGFQFRKRTLPPGAGDSLKPPPPHTPLPYPFPHRRWILALVVKTQTHVTTQTTPGGARTGWRTPWGPFPGDQPLPKLGEGAGPLFGFRPSFRLPPPSFSPSLSHSRLRAPSVSFGWWSLGSFAHPGWQPCPALWSFCPHFFALHRPGETHPNPKTKTYHFTHAYTMGLTVFSPSSCFRHPWARPLCLQWI